MFRHPKYYKELRKRNKLDQAISGKNSTECKTRSPGPGLQQIIEETVPHNDIEEASSDKPQATSSQASSGKHQAPSNKHQAASRKQQAP
jgi:hypothetical protein